MQSSSKNKVIAAGDDHNIQDLEDVEFMNELAQLSKAKLIHLPLKKQNLKQGGFNTGRTSHARIGALDYKQYQVLKITDYKYPASPLRNHMSPIEHKLLDKSAYSGQ